MYSCKDALTVGKTDREYMARAYIIMHSALVIAFCHRLCTPCSNKSPDSLMGFLRKAIVRFQLTSVRRGNILQRLRDHLPNMYYNQRTSLQTPITSPTVPLGTVHICTWILEMPFKDNCSPWSIFRMNFSHK